MAAGVTLYSFKLPDIVIASYMVGHYITIAIRPRPIMPA